MRMLTRLSLLLLLYSGCDNTARLTIRAVHMDHLQVLDAKLTADGNIRIDFNIQSTSQFDGTDTDRQVRPDDYIQLIRIVLGETFTDDSFEVELDCLDAQAADPTACGGVVVPTSEVVALDFHDRLDGVRGRPINVSILIDNSGSTTGMVQEGTCLEAKSGSVKMPSNLYDCASDRGGARLAAAFELEILLEHAGVVQHYAFDELNGVRIVPSSDVHKLLGRGVGRSNLWRAIATAHEDVREAAQPVLPAARHIVVFTDGPDTCTPEVLVEETCFGGPTDPVEQEPCPSNLTFEALMAVLAVQPEAVHVSFVHFDGPGYRGVDPLMQRVAALTGGHYLFVDTSESLPATLGKALTEHVAVLRNALGGFWSLTLDVPAIELVDEGDSYGLEGMLSLTGGRLARQDSRARFSRLPLLYDCTQL